MCAVLTGPGGAVGVTSAGHRRIKVTASAETVRSSGGALLQARHQLAGPPPPPPQPARPPRPCSAARRPLSSWTCARRAADRQRPKSQSWQDWGSAPLSVEFTDAVATGPNDGAVPPVERQLRTLLSCLLSISVSWPAACSWLVANCADFLLQHTGWAAVATPSQSKITRTVGGGGGQSVVGANGTATPPVAWRPPSGSKASGAKPETNCQWPQNSVLLVLLARGRCAHLPRCRPAAVAAAVEARSRSAAGVPAAHLCTDQLAAM